MTPSEEKLLRLALDPAAHAGEADNAAVALIRSMRKRGVSAYSPTGLEKEKSFSAPPPPKQTPGNFPIDWPGSIVLDFGKYKGKRLAEIDPGYFRWALREWDPLTRGDLLAAMRWLLEDLASRQRNRGFR